MILTFLQADEWMSLEEETRLDELVLDELDQRFSEASYVSYGQFILENYPQLYAIYSRRN